MSEMRRESILSMAQGAIEEKVDYIGLFEADGGIWKLDARDNIMKYFEEKLKHEISVGAVVVLT